MPVWAGRTHLPNASQVPCVPVHPLRLGSEHAMPAFLGVTTHPPVVGSQKPTLQSDEAHGGGRLLTKHPPEKQMPVPHAQLALSGRVVHDVRLLDTWHFLHELLG